MLGDCRLDAFQIAVLQDGFATLPRPGFKTRNALLPVAMDSALNRHLATSYDLRHLTRGATLTFEQDHLASPPKSVAGATLITLFQGRPFSGV